MSALHIVRTFLIGVSFVALLRQPVSAGDGFPSGAAIFNARCASCHGTGGMADGPLAPALNPHPANLTTISRRNGGSFPAARVVEIITYGGNIVAHGTGPMPVWGKIFSTEGGHGKIGASTSRRNLIALKRYLESIQK